jgi:NAD(P)-dependent dehydrogenase (short-subunit alcohol dehydrogenase family)
MTAPATGFDRRVAVVTGAASGIGAAVAARLRAAGARVASIDLRAAAGVDLACEADVGDAAAVQRAVERVASELAPPTLGVHAAGITRDGMLWKITPDDWDLVLRVNLTGAWNLLRALTPHQRAAGGGSVVFVGSINGLRGKLGQSAYAASKAGLTGLAKTAARELGRFGVRVNVLAPGWVDTPMTAALGAEWREKAVAESVLGRVAAPDDIAACAEFLLSDGARHVTGQVLSVDGGQRM